MPSFDFQVISSWVAERNPRTCGFASVSGFHAERVATWSIDGTVKIVDGVCPSAYVISSRPLSSSLLTDSDACSLVIWRTVFFWTSSAKSWLVAFQPSLKKIVLPSLDQKPAETSPSKLPPILRNGLSRAPTSRRYSRPFVML